MSAPLCQACTSAVSIVCNRPAVYVAFHGGLTDACTFRCADHPPEWHLFTRVRKLTAEERTLGLPFGRTR